MDIATEALISALKNIRLFSRAVLRHPLRAYQVEPASAIISACIRRQGDELVIRFPRQTGKNETIAIAEAMLLFLFQRAGGTIVHTAPTYKPQAENARNRLLAITAGNPFFAGLTTRDNVVTCQRSNVHFLTGQTREQPIVGPTANIALFADEAQDLDEAYFDRAFSPMTASTNAPIIYTGTARHDQTLLAKRRRAAEAKEKQDGRRRVFVITWRDVEPEVPAYGAKVRAEIERKGVHHPIVRTEYENIEDEQTGKLFNQRRLSLVTQTGQPRHCGPQRGAVYVVTIDVGGTTLQPPTTSDQRPPDHDPTVAAVHLVTFTAKRQPVFTTIDYLSLWGKNVLDDTPDRASLFAHIKLWSPRRIVTDATGLGVGLASALTAAFPNVVEPITLSAAFKTDLLNNFLALVETGRYHHYIADAGNGSTDPDHARAMAQLQACVADQHGRYTEWGIDASVTWLNPRTLKKEPLHDDHLLAVSYVGVLAEADLGPAYVGAIVQHEAPESPKYRRGRY
jgi:hypothetical protein